MTILKLFLLLLVVRASVSKITVKSQKKYITEKATPSKETLNLDKTSGDESKSGERKKKSFFTKYMLDEYQQWLDQPIGSSAGVHKLAGVKALNDNYNENVEDELYYHGNRLVRRRRRRDTARRMGGDTSTEADVEESGQDTSVELDTEEGGQDTSSRDDLDEEDDIVKKEDKTSEVTEALLELTQLSEAVSKEKKLVTDLVERRKLDEYSDITDYDNEDGTESDVSDDEKDINDDGGEDNETDDDLVYNIGDSDGKGSADNIEPFSDSDVGKMDARDSILLAKLTYPHRLPSHDKENSPRLNVEKHKNKPEVPVHQTKKQKMFAKLLKSGKFGRINQEKLDIKLEHLLDNEYGNTVNVEKSVPKEKLLKKIGMLKAKKAAKIKIRDKLRKYLEKTSILPEVYYR